MIDHNYPFDPTHGYDREALQAVLPPDGPADFDAFWQETHQANEAVPLDLQVEEIAPFREGWRMQIVRFSVLDGIRVGGWLEIPATGSVEIGAIAGHGYGGRDAPDLPAHRAAFLHVCAPGFNLSAAPGLPNDCGKHVLHGIEHRETYLIRHCVCATWTAIRVLEEVLQRSLRIYYFGGSFGGGLGALAMPYDQRFQKCVLFVPTFGHQPLRLQCRSQGSGEPVRLYAQEHPEVRDVLAYYDAGTAALRISLPNITAPALFDPAVPPVGQFAVSNPMRRYGHQFCYTAGHHEYAEAAAEERTLQQWIDEYIWGP